MRYAVIDSDNNVVNVIIWDGEAPYDPGPGKRLERVRQGEEHQAVIGGRWYGATRFVDPSPPVVEPEQ